MITKPINLVQRKPVNKTLEGVLINSHVKNQNGGVNFDEISNELLIADNYDKEKDSSEFEKKESFNIKKALVPLGIGLGAVFLGAGAISSVAKKSSKALLNSKRIEQLPDLALNNNIKQETQFAMYRMIRDPNFSNVFGAVCVFLFSGLTLALKNFTQGVKEVWIKKQNADIERDLQENLIEVEADAFSGKLNVINTMFKENAEYFERVLNKEKQDPEIFFSKHFNFKGNEKREMPDKKTDIKTAVLGGAAILGAVGASYFTLKNLKHTIKNAGDFANKYTEKTIEAIENIAERGNSQENISALDDLFQSINAKPDYIKDTMTKMGVKDDIIQETIKNAEESKKTLFADAPTALGGIPKKIQYYCYLDEDRGHLYNWVTHPESKFAKYIFLSFSAITAMGYAVTQGLEAVKSVAVNRENAKTDLNLKKRLVEVEVANFKAKKESAIKPLVETFNQKKAQGASEEELRHYASNILTEIKNGPPYVYS